MRIVLVCLLSGLAVASTAIGQEKQIVLPADHDYATLKPGLHSELAQTQCQFCHSTDYIVMQPGGDAEAVGRRRGQDGQGLWGSPQRSRREGHHGILSDD